MARIFFSYSHDNDAHKKWVKKAADDLSSIGLEVILDQTHLKFGQDIHKFAENAVLSSDYVLLICTPKYATRANSRRYGVGKETALISSELYEGKEEKFIAVLKEGDHKTSIPSYVKHKLFVDVRNDGIHSEAWSQLRNDLLSNTPVDEIGTLIWEALFPYNPNRIYEKPKLPALKRFTEFVETGKNDEGRWFVVRHDPIKKDTAIILFQNPKNAPNDSKGNPKFRKRLKIYGALVISFFAVLASISGFSGYTLKDIFSNTSESKLTNPLSDLEDSVKESSNTENVIADSLMLPYLDNVPILDKGIYIRYNYNDLNIGGVNVDSLKLNSRSRNGDQLEIRKFDNIFQVPITEEPFIEIGYKGKFYSLELTGSHYSFYYTLTENIELTMSLKTFGE